jgi:hypothetical protein
VPGLPKEIPCLRLGIMTSLDAPILSQGTNHARRGSRSTREASWPTEVTEEAGRDFVICADAFDANDLLTNASPLEGE